MRVVEQNVGCGSIATDSYDWFIWEKRRITEGYMEGDVNTLGPDEMVIMTDSYQRF